MKTIISIIVVVLVAWGIYSVAGNGATNEINGTVSYLPKIALASGAVIEIKLIDTSEQDADSQVISSQTITTKGENVPIPFTLKYKASDINASSTYSVGARIMVGGNLEWMSTQAYPVITNGYSNNADVYVTSMR